MVKYTANGTPSEDDEEATFADWLDLHGLRHTHLSNEMFTRSPKIKARMKMLGVHSGPPDHLIIVPCVDGKKRLVYIEMKRQKGGEISDNQFDWLHDLIACEGVIALVAKGAHEACRIIGLVEECNWNALTPYEDDFLAKYEKNQEKRAKNAKIRKNEDIF